MTIIVFLIDTSASMNQRTYLGGRPSLLDVAKSAVEYFVKVRQRSPESRGDRYMLLTFDDPPDNIRAGWKENLSTFMAELKNLQATGLTTLGTALRHTFDVLNVNRMQHGIDTYGQGRCPFYLEPSIIVVITDGGRISSCSGVTDEIKLLGTSPGAELTREPFRWDQRLFGLVLKMNGQPTNEREIGLVPSDDSPIDTMCEATGGRSYAITTHRMLHQCLESIAQKVVAGVVLHFEKFGPDPVLQEGEEDDGKWQSNHRMIHVPRTAQKGGFAGGCWPIPESFYPEPSLPSLSPRSAHPNVRFMCVPHEPLIIENFPFDKYELEPSPLTQFILARKSSSICWQVFLPNSSKNGGLGSAFGYLKASSNLTTVNLFVMPYNYPVLLPLLLELQLNQLKASSYWRGQFAKYLSSIPPYYMGPLKRALLRIGAGSIAQTVPEESYLSYSVLNYLKKLKYQAKTEYERTCTEIGTRLQGKEAAIAVPGIAMSIKNPFDIPREDLLDSVAKLRALFFRPQNFESKESLHAQPIQQMGNYQEYLKRLPSPLREIETTPVRQHMFGNPFKIDRRIVIDKIDEADMSDPSPLDPAEVMPHLKMKRKPGPLPTNYHFIPMKDRVKGESPWGEEEQEMFIKPPPTPVTPIPNPGESESDSSYLDDLDSEESDEEDLVLDLDPPTVPITEAEPADDVRSPESEDAETEDESDEQAEEEPMDAEQAEFPQQEEEPDSVQEEEDAETEDETEEETEDEEDEEQEEEPEPVLDDETIFKTNVKVRVEIFKEIRRPLVRMEMLHTQLSLLVGSGETKLKMIKLLEKEAIRFKRQKLAKLFEEQAKKVIAEMKN